MCVPPSRIPRSHSRASVSASAAPTTLARGDLKSAFQRPQLVGSLDVQNERIVFGADRCCHGCLVVPLGVWPSSQLARCTGGRVSWRVSGGVAVLPCCTARRISRSGRSGSDRFRLDQRAWSVPRGRRRTALTCNQNCNLQIRRSGQAVQDRPVRPVGWADIPRLSIRGRRCPPSWQQLSAAVTPNGTRQSASRPSGGISGARPDVQTTSGLQDCGSASFCGRTADGAG
jgi:hypothetical protein